MMAIKTKTVPMSAVAIGQKFKIDGEWAEREDEPAFVYFHVVDGAPTWESFDPDGPLPVEIEDV